MFEFWNSGIPTFFSGGDDIYGTMSFWDVAIPFLYDEEVTVIYSELSGSIAATSMLSAALGMIFELSGCISATGTITDSASLAYVWDLGGLVRGRSNTPGSNLIAGMELSGSIDAESEFTGILSMRTELSGSMDGESELTGILSFEWEEPPIADWTDWDEYEGDDEVWILRTDEADDSWTEREEA